MELVLVINCGSSSHKCSLFEGDDHEPLWRAHLEWKEGFRDAHLTVVPEGIDKNIDISSSKDGLEKLLQTLPQKQITAIGHRVVHGGEVFRTPTPITKEVKEKIGELVYLAPLHNPANLEGIEVTQSLFAHVPQFAIFDTAFHATLSETAAAYPLPYACRQEGIRRYGFHGISHAYCSKRAAEFLQHEGKMIICHLGAGASLCAVEKGKSIDTTMGMTPLEGLMMASRSGSVDPGILLHLLSNKKSSVNAIDQMLNKESGIFGISGISEDMRDILDASEQGNQRAQLALDMFIHSLKKHIGMMIAALEGLDVLIFTAGIGEHASLVREKTCEAFAFLGLQLDREKNRSPSHEVREISQPDSKIQVLVIPTQEEWEITRQILLAKKKPG